MQGNSNFERKQRTSKNARPPRGNEQVERQQQEKRGKQWSRENNKRDQWNSFDSFQ
jgi:hypothetical protein